MRSGWREVRDKATAGIFARWSVSLSLSSAGGTRTATKKSPTIIINEIFPPCGPYRFINQYTVQIRSKTST